MTTTAPILDDDGIARRTLPSVVQIRVGRDHADGERTITGIGVPFGETFEIFPGLSERFEPGALDDDGDALAFWRHSEPIGRVVDSRDTEAGREVTLKLSTTPTADEAHTLARDGVIRSMSVGFVPIDYRVETDDDGNETIIHTRVRALEYSLVPFPAYSEASILSVRHRTQERPTMTQDTNTDVLTREDLDHLSNDFTTKLDDIKRSMDHWRADDAAVDAIDTRAELFGSIGEWVSAVANDRDERHEDALALHRDLTTSDIPSKLVDKPGFIGDLTKRIVERRRWINRFRTRPLPAKGMSVDYIKTEVAAVVDEQTEELASVKTGAAFEVTPDSAPVRTFGGGDTVSRQVIDRSDPWALTGMFEAFALQYARETEAATRTYINGRIDALLPESPINLPTEWGAFDWIDALVDVAGIFEDKGYDLEALTLSPDLFKQLAREAGLDGRPLLTVHGAGVNVVGELNLPAASGNLMRLPVDVLHGSTGRALFYDPVAIETLESPGAPFWLQEDRALNLARDYACYGYLAHINPHPGALVPVRFED